jgi:hypothetical protein
VKRLFAGLILIIGAAPAPAQPQTEGPIKLKLPPAAAPVPALKYPLLPELSEQTPGNAVQLYYRAFSPDWWSNVHKREVMDKVQRAVQTPIADLKNSDLRWLLDFNALREVDRAARRAYCEWELTDRIKEDGIFLLIPDIQGIREFATFLTVRARLEMAEGRLDRALETLRTGFAMARHVGDGTTLIQALVGIAVATRMVEQLEEWLGQPGASNMYWSLTDLPRPLIELRKPLQGEKLWLVGTFAQLRDVDRPHLSPEQREGLVAVAAGLVTERFDPRDPPPDTATRLAVMAWVAKDYPAAKAALLAAGRKPDEVEALPALQVVLSAAVREFERRRDDMFKWASLPYTEARPALMRANREIIEERSARPDALSIAQQLLPGVVKVVDAAARLDRRIAALRCIEAVRLHAAAHDGKPPAALSDVTEVPIPGDPITGKPFEYQVNGNTFTLSAGPPAGEAPTPYTVLAYEVTLRK